MNISLLLSEYVVSFLIIHEWAAMVNNGSGNYWRLDGSSALPSPMLRYLEWDFFSVTQVKNTHSSLTWQFLPSYLIKSVSWRHEYLAYKRCVEVIYLFATTLAMIILMGLCKKALTPLIWHQTTKMSKIDCVQARIFFIFILWIKSFNKALTGKYW